MSDALNGLHDIVDDYDVIITDQYGVLHDGRNIYPGVIDCLEQLRRRGKRVGVLGNSGRRADANRRRLNDMGFTDAQLPIIMTSGELTWLTLRDRSLPALAEASRVQLITGSGGSTLLDGLDFTAAENGSDADLVLIVGAEQEHLSISDYLHRLCDAMQRKLPCLCANPDHHSLLNGSYTYGPAAVAEAYAACGAELHYFGKPHTLIYRRLAEQLQATPDDRVLCIGDSPAHDIVGAANAGYASVLVQTGLQSMGIDSEPMSAQPDYRMPALRW